MKKRYVFLFVLISIIVGLTPAYLYLLNFNESTLPLEKVISNISKDNQAWGNFGSFLSGTTGALFSFIGTLAVIWTLIKTHESSEKQMKMLSSEQTFNQFNKLLDLLIEILENKRYTSVHISGRISFTDFKDDTYEAIRILLSEHLTSNSHAKKSAYLNFGSISVFYDNYTSYYLPDIFKKESAIYTVLLDKIMNADQSTKEALIAILLAKMNEHHLFFLNCKQMGGLGDRRMLRMAKSGIPLSIPNELMRLLEIT
jgi:hypothetical protein